MKNLLFLCPQKRKHQKDMNTSNYIKSIIDNSGLTKEEAAKAMFPDNDYPNEALRSVLSGKTDVRIRSLVSLLRAAGVNVEEALAATMNMKGRAEDHKICIKNQFGVIKVFDGYIEIQLKEESNMTITIFANYDNSTKLTDVKDIAAKRIARFFDATNI